MKSLMIFLLLIPGDSSIKHRLLEDGTTKVPADANYFTKNYRNKYQVSKPEGIEPGVLYVELYYIDINNKWFKTAGRYDQAPSALLFYANGCVNKFSYGENFHLNPEVGGFRGMSFTKKGKHLIEIIAPVNQLYNLGRIRYDYSVSGDTLFINRPDTDSRYVYIKDKSGLKSTYIPTW